jgi:succinate dehydrogenase / fumarate reductase cytochrome b subunit
VQDETVEMTRSNAGRKIFMAITGGIMILFVAAHLLGNISFFSGPDGINAYAKMIHSLGPFRWVIRLIMAAVLGLHMVFGIQLTLENRTSRAQKYAVNKHLSATAAGKNMIWTGLLIALYLGYHLLHFTVQVITPEFSAIRNLDALGRPDVFSMVVRSFRNIFVSVVYVMAMAAVGLHLSHGLQSMVQTLGLNSERTLPVMVKIGAVAALVLFLGYVAIPAVIISGLVGR